jgi:transcriptional regulator with XRE-family HTH domain
MPKPNKLARFLEDEQRRLDLTQEEFARLIKISQPFLSRIITGHKKINSIDTLFAIAELTSKSVDELKKMMQSR